MPHAPQTKSVHGDVYTVHIYTQGWMHACVFVVFFFFKEGSTRMATLDIQKDTMYFAPI